MPKKTSNRKPGNGPMMPGMPMKDMPMMKKGKPKPPGKKR